MDHADLAALVAGLASPCGRGRASIRRCTSRGCWRLRKLAYLAFLGQPYRFGPLSTEFPYEFRKDLMARGLASIIYYLSLKRNAREAAAQAQVAPLAASFDIRDGARLVRVPVSDLLAVRSAGNYAEFLLADGRRPLMRSSLSALEARRWRQHSFLRSSSPVAGRSDLRGPGCGPRLGRLRGRAGRRGGAAVASLSAGPGGAARLDPAQSP